MKKAIVLLNVLFAFVLIAAAQEGIHISVKPSQLNNGW